MLQLGLCRLLNPSSLKPICQRFKVDISLFQRLYSTSDVQLTLLEYEKISSETLDSLHDAFDELIESHEKKFTDADVYINDGVLTVKLEPFGTYVINKQTPNLQIWLSSPISGPKRYDFVNNAWIYRHDKILLHKLLSNEMSNITKSPIDFSKCRWAEESKK